MILPQNERRRRMLALALCLLVVLFNSALMVSGATEALAPLRVGSSGNDVRTLQTKLKNWGYYSGVADGKFGQATLDAVKFFQRKNGLTPDGVVGAATAAKLGMTLGGTATASKGTSTAGSSNVSGTQSADINLLAKLVYAEARGEPYSGKVAVAACTLSRVKNSSFPNTISSVIYQPGAYSSVSDGQINLAPDASALQAARDAMNGADPSGGALYFYNPAKTTNKWMLSRPVLCTIGEHRFCK